MAQPEKSAHKIPHELLAEFVQMAHAMANKSGVAILKHFRKTLEINDKTSVFGFDPVTIADREGEQVIRAMITEQYPEHGIVGEEFGQTNPAADYQWIIDPVDGTRAFIIGAPTWGTLIGLSHKNKPVIGIMNQPFTGECYWSDARNAYYRRENRLTTIKTSKCSRLADATLCTTGLEYFAAGDELASFQHLSSQVRMTRMGLDCYAYCLLASGYVDIIAEAGLKNFDIAPLIPIIEQAGGIVTAWDGGSAASGGRVLASATRRLHEQAMQTLKAH
jgi:myo-inositol-1(or 4)-monophosphatase